MGSGRRAFAVSVAVAVALVLLSAACNSGGGSPAIHNPSTTTATTRLPASTTTTLDPTRAAILAAYRAEWADVIAVSTRFPIRPLDTRLASHATGKELLAIQEALTQLNLKGQYEMGTLELSPVITSLSDSTAIISECDFDHFVEIDARTGHPVDQPDVGHTLIKFTMTKINGNWFVSDSTTLASGKTIDACTPSAS